MTGAEMIAAERRRQMEQEGWTPEHDDEHDAGELALAAACYAAPKPIYVHERRVVQLNASRGAGDAYLYDYGQRLGYYDPWPWDEEYDKRQKHGRLRQLIIAGALIAAEIDRLARRATVAAPTGDRAEPPVDPFGSSEYLDDNSVLPESWPIPDDVRRAAEPTGGGDAPSD